MIMDAYTGYNSEKLVAEYRQLLLNLKTTAEGLFLSQVCNVWNVYGGLNRLHNAVESIFKHGTRVYKPDGTPDSWLFIEGLNWINPSLADASGTFTDLETPSTIPYSRIKNDKALTWIYRNLENHTLSQKLSWLISDREHLSSCFEKSAYLCQERYSEAALICLRAVEQNQPSIITDIDPYLFLNRTCVKQLHKSHRRCSSYPEFVNYLKVSIKREPIAEHINNTAGNSNPEINMGNQHSITEVDYTKIAEAEGPYKEKEMEVNESAPTQKQSPKKRKRNRKRNEYNMKPWSSFPTVNSDKTLIPQTIENNAAVSRKSSIDSSICNENNPHCDDFSAAFSEQLNQNDPTELNKNFSNITILNCEDIKIHTHTSAPSESPTCNIDETPIEVNIATQISRPVHLPIKKRFSFFSWDSVSHLNDITKATSKLSLLPNSAPGFLFNNMPMPGEKIQSRTNMKSFIEDGGSSILPMATGFFPTPTPGQSLTSFLTSSQFNRANAELDRENAHFSISEAMIAAVEQLKWNKIQPSNEELLESDEEINSLKQRIRLRRKQRQQEKYRLWQLPLMSDGKTDTTTESISPLSSSDTCDSDVSDSVDLDLEACGKLKDFQDLSVSLGSLYSSTDLSRNRLMESTPNSAIIRKMNSSSPPLTEDHLLSAEGVALSLLRRFNEKQLPRASELVWLVSESDAPQRMLPMPTSWPVSPMSEEDKAQAAGCYDGAVPLRGTADWAPPRAQVIFTRHPAPVRKKLLAHQNWRCTGCAMRVAEQYASRFRYCEYLGRYHCTGCHNNQVSPIPGRVLGQWDFKRCPVSNFSYRLLERMWGDPLFRVGSVAPALYGKVRALAKCKILREKLFQIKDFVVTCRFAENLDERLKNEQSYIYNEPDIWSMADFVQVRNGEMLPRLTELVKACEIHISSCELCSARGFVCEVCSRGTIFPWQNKITRCALCGSCYHSSCWNPSMKCSKCIRIQKRKHPR